MLKVSRPRAAASRWHDPPDSPWLASDDAFDELYADVWRTPSRRHWTPVEVARIAAHWLTEDPSVTEVLDVGAGVGKLCIVGALETGRRFSGIEQRPRLVRAAAAAAHAAGVSSHVAFRCDRVSLGELGAYRAFYLFNPFGENGLDPEERIDGTVELSDARYQADIRLVEEALRVAPLGQRIVTYHGFGGRVPRGYVEEHHEPAGSDAVRLWVKHCHFD